VQFLGELIQWVETARYLGVSRYAANLVGTRQPGEEDGSRNIGHAWPLLNRRSDLSVRNDVLLYKQLIRPMMHYTCPIWRSTASSHVKNLHVLQSKCLRIATNAPWYVGNREIHEDLRIPFFADHTRALTESFDSKLTDAGKPLVRQLGRHLADRGLTEVTWETGVM
jgi:hypothetical protein